MTKGVRVPLKIDDNTVNGNLGHYARVLVEVDLATNLPETLLLEKFGKSFFFCNSYMKTCQTFVLYDTV